MSFLEVKKVVKGTLSRFIRTNMYDEFQRISTSRMTVRSFGYIFASFRDPRKFVFAGESSESKLKCYERELPRTQEWETKSFGLNHQPIFNQNQTVIKNKNISKKRQIK